MSDINIRDYTFPWDWEFIKKMSAIWRSNKRRELKGLLNNCVDDDEVILYQREIEGLEEVKDNG